MSCVIASSFWSHHRKLLVASSKKEYDRIPPRAVETTVHHVYSLLRDEERDIARLHDMAWIGDVNPVTFPRCECQPRDFCTAAGR
jgi:hypothetical protein